MKLLVVLSAIVASCVARPNIAYSAVGAPWGYYGAGLAPWSHGWAGAPFFAHRAAVVPAVAPAVVPAVAPAVVPAVAPAVVPAFAPALKSQYHAQNEIGQASYGHAEPLQTHHAVQDSVGNKVGSYSYLNPHDGKIHRTDYVADALGYRVAANDLPAAPEFHPVLPDPVVDTPEVAEAKAAHIAKLEAVAANPAADIIPAAPVELPAPVEDTPEVAEAKAAHLAEHAAATTRTRRSVLLTHTPAATAPSYTPPLAYAAAPILHHAPLAYSAPLVHAPVAYAAAPALREATLTTIVNNPGHAVSYRVD